VSATISFDSYRRLIENRPFKFDEEEVNYRKSTGEEKCGGCAHYFTRALDKFGVCEIFRPTEGEESVLANYVCDFHNVNGEDYPLLQD
jgi:hypothetical protein